MNDKKLGSLDRGSTDMDNEMRPTNFFFYGMIAVMVFILLIIAMEFGFSRNDRTITVKDCDNKIGYCKTTTIEFNNFGEDVNDSAIIEAVKNLKWR